MSKFETEPSKEADEFKRRFVAFVEAHSEESTSGLKGEVRKAHYALDVPNQLVPVNRVVFEVFDADPDEDPGVDLGYAIVLNDGDIFRFGITLSRGEFGQSIGEFDEIPAGIDSAQLLMGEVERLEAEGRLTSTSS